MGPTDCVSWKPGDIKKNHLINAMSLARPREAEWLAREWRMASKKEGHNVFKFRHAETSKTYNQKYYV